MPILKSVIVGLLLILTANGWAKENKLPSQPKVTKLANPASSKCIQDGYQLLPQNYANGFVSNYDCVNSKNNKHCSEWDYFRNTCALK